MTFTNSRLILTVRASRSGYSALRLLSALLLCLCSLACSAQAPDETVDGLPASSAEDSEAERGFTFDLLPASKEIRGDAVIVYKSARRMDLMLEGERVRSYRISLGANPVGHKQQEGDSRTPEGDYVIDWRNPKSKFHLSLHISYPDRQDRASAAKRGVSPGGDIMIHGLPNGWAGAGPALAGVDWTDGCIAVDNWAIEELWKAIPNGTPISILP